MMENPPPFLFQGVLGGDQHTDADGVDHADPGEVHNNLPDPLIHKGPQTPAELLGGRGNDVLARHDDAVLFLLKLIFH